MKKYHHYLWFAFFGLTVGTTGLAMASDQEGKGLERGSGDASSSSSVDHALSQSIIVQCSSGISEAYAASDKDMLTDKSKSRVYFLVDKNSSSTWEALINLGVQRGGFTEQDLLFTINEYAMPRKLSKEHAELLFSLMITKQFTGHNVEALTTLLTSPKIEVADKWLGSVKNERLSLLANLVELAYYSPRYLDALRSILTALPIETVNTSVAVTRDEYTGKGEGGYFDYQYTPKSYTLLGWLTRSHNEIANYYLDVQHHMRKYYVGAAKILIDRNLANKVEGDQKDISPALFRMMTLLHHQNDVDVEQFETAAPRLNREQK